MLAAFLLCCTPAVLTSCNDDDVEDFMESINLIGTWEVTGYTVTPAVADGDEINIAKGQKIVFKNDLTFIDSEGNSGTWKISEKKIYVTYPGEKEALFAEVKSYTRDDMVLTVISDPYTIHIGLKRVK